MKKAFLTLGLVVVAYTSYAMNTSEELKIVKESTIEMVEEDVFCTRTVVHYDHEGYVIGYTIEPC